MNMTKFITLSATILALMSMSSPAQAQAERYIAEIFTTGANFCPRGTAELNGQLLPISSNSALFSLLGTTYGGDGRTTFGLPDMRGRSAVHEGNGPGLSNVRLGQKGGTETISLKSTTLANKPTKDGTIVARSDEVNNRSPYLALKYCMVTQGMYPSRS